MKMAFGWQVSQCTLEFKSNMLAKIYSIKQGLQMSWDLGKGNIVLQSDSKEAISLVEGPSLLSDPLQGLLKDIRSLLAQQWTCQIVHVL